MAVTFEIPIKLSSTRLRFVSFEIQSKIDSKMPKARKEIIGKKKIIERVSHLSYDFMFENNETAIYFGGIDSTSHRHSSDPQQTKRKATKVIKQDFISATFSVLSLAVSFFLVPS